MRILMLGNSFTYYNDMPSMLADLTGAEVVAHTRGGAYLTEQLDPDTEIGAKTLNALEKESWDYVILQEYSNGPVVAKDAFLNSVTALCEKIRQGGEPRQGGETINTRETINAGVTPNTDETFHIGATPILYATWPYQKGTEKMAEMAISYDVMAAQLSAAYHEAAEQCDTLIADVGQKFYQLSGKPGQLSETIDLYDEDGYHPTAEGSRIAAETIADIIKKDQKKHLQAVLPQGPHPDDQRLRILYLYQMLLRHTDPDHPMSAQEIRARMTKEHGITMHRTTLPSDVALLQAAGVPIRARRTSVMLYNMEESYFELAELKILIDAVESSKFITEKKSQALVEKLLKLTSEVNGEALKRTVHTSGRVRSGNEKGYYIVDAINKAINEGKQISLFYTEYDANKQQVLRNDGNPYTVSPYTLIWNGDYYYLVGWYHEKERVTVFRVDRILTQPIILKEKAMPKPSEFDITRYTNEVFRMYDTEEIRKVTLCCENSVMKGVIDEFGTDINVRKKDKSHFLTKVNVCTSPTFYAWVFQWGGAVKITAPKRVVEEYKAMVEKAI